MQSDPIARLFFCFTLFGLAGCGSDGPALGKVSGIVTLDGKPVPAATVTFHPENTAGSPSYGRTDDQGNYSLMFTRDKHGAMIGKHRVNIATTKISASEAAEMRAEGQDVPTTAYVAIPPKYRDPGALTAEVESGSNEISFELTSK